MEGKEERNRFMAISFVLENARKKVREIITLKITSNMMETGNGKQNFVNEL